MFGKRNKTTPAITEASDDATRDAAEEAELEAKYGPRFKFDPESQGPSSKNRGCTDVFCLLLFVAFLGAWGFVAFIGFRNGDVKKLLHPTDSLGRVCGTDELENRPYLLFFDLTKCLNPAVLAIGCPTRQVCVEKCPEEAFSGLALATAGMTAESKAKMKPFCVRMSQSDWDRQSAMELIRKNLCPEWVLPSVPYLGRCMPLGSVSKPDNDSVVVDMNETLDHEEITGATIGQAVTALGAFLSVRDFGEKLVNDIGSSWYFIGVGYILALVLSVIWIVLLRFLAGFMVWSSIVLVLLSISSLFGYSLYKYFMVRTQVGADQNIFQVNITPAYFHDVLRLEDTWLAFVVILGVILGILLLLMIALRQRINIAISLISQGAKAVGSLVSTLVFPVVPFFLHVFVFCLYAVVAMMISSSGVASYRVAYAVQGSTVRTAANGTSVSPPTCPAGACVNPISNLPFEAGDTCDTSVFSSSGCDLCSPQVNCQFFKYGVAEITLWLHLVNLFGFYWAMNFVTSYNQMVLAGAFAAWYWKWDKSKVSNSALLVSLTNVTIYHLGTISFGSLIIAIIRILRAILDYVDDKLKRFSNDLVRCLLCLCKCCLWCLEKFMRFLNTNAYIMCAIKGTNFCSSAKHAFNLLMRNIVRVVVLNRVVEFLLFMGKLVIVVTVGVSMYFVFSGDIPELTKEVPTLNYMFVPTVMVVIGSYVITSSFFNVYAMAVDTLFLCFLEDLERNDGTPERPYFMSRGLQKAVGKMQKFQENQIVPAARR